jgi:hypothetical protein
MARLGFGFHGLDTEDGRQEDTLCAETLASEPDLRVNLNSASCQLHDQVFQSPSFLSVED